MNTSDKKICIIACINDEQLWRECLLYINNLIVPDGYSLEILSVKDAVSMTSGYNEAMNSSDAKYKFYIHQDILITDKYILVEFINIFISNPDLGMLGVTGTKDFPIDGCMFNTNRVSSAYWRDNKDFSEYCDKPTPLDNISLCNVSLVDGLLIATQYDFPWREDVFTKWDHYDSSQSIEFAKKGYICAIPMINKPLCIHNDGQRLSLRNYLSQTYLMLKTYEKDIIDCYKVDVSYISDMQYSDYENFFTTKANSIIPIYSESFYDNARTKYESQVAVINELLSLSTNEAYLEAILLSTNEDMLRLSEVDANTLCLIIGMRAAEFEHNENNCFNFLAGKNVDSIIEEVNYLIIYLRRIESHMPLPCQMELIDYVLDHNISFDIVFIVLNLVESIYNKESIISQFSELLKSYHPSE